MSEDLRERLAAALQSSERPLTTQDLSAAVGVGIDVVQRTLWGDPEHFAWQPGHRWSLTTQKPSATSSQAARGAIDTHEALLQRGDPQQLRARTLSNGLEIAIIAMSQDSSAPFSVRSRGRRLEIVLNATHQLFCRFGTPLTERLHGAADVLDVLLAGWALMEDSSASKEKRTLEDVRQQWGRRIEDVLAG